MLFYACYPAVRGCINSLDILRQTCVSRVLAFYSNTLLQKVWSRETNISETLPTKLGEDMVNSIIEEIYRTGVVQDKLGDEYKLQSSVGKDEGEFILQLIRSDPNIRKTLEIGCAYGLSSLYICSALSERNSAKHIIVDPKQHKDWHGIGIANLQKADFGFFELIEKPSEFVLPDIAQNESGTFDLVFIDGWHTFDHTLLDLFYANRLIKVGGYIVVDDCNWSSVAKAVSYILKYPSYQLNSQCLSKLSLKRALGNVVKTLIPPSIANYMLPRNLYDRYYIRTLYSSMVALKKVASDERDWEWFEPF
jgi:predicted O-methyltransferase YrrM